MRAWEDAAAPGAGTLGGTRSRACAFRSVHLAGYSPWGLRLGVWSGERGALCGGPSSTEQPAHPELVGTLFGSRGGAGPGRGHAQEVAQREEGRWVSGTPERLPGQPLVKGILEVTDRCFALSLPRSKTKRTCPRVGFYKSKEETGWSRGLAKLRLGLWCGTAGPTADLPQALPGLGPPPPPGGPPRCLPDAESRAGSSEGSDLPLS